MANLDSIAVSVEYATGNVMPILHEVRHALQRLQETGKSAVIDLMAIPMTLDEEKQLDALLGQGEVKALLDSLGPSEIYETEIAGVWFVTHYNFDRERVGRFLEIARLPTILESQEADMRCGLAELVRRIESLEAGEAMSPAATRSPQGDRSKTTRTMQ